MIVKALVSYDGFNYAGYYQGDLYGRHIEVEFVAKLRDEVKFNDLPALTAQMHRDAEQARNILNEQRLRATA